MTRPIPEQYRQFYTPEQLARRDNDIAFEKMLEQQAAARRERDLVYNAVLAHSEECEDYCQQLEAIKDQILVESFSTLAAGGLEITLHPDENDVVSVEQLLPFASLTTQVKYRDTLKAGLQKATEHKMLYDYLQKML